MNRDEINDLLTDFDEMGFCPTTLVHNPEEYAINWRYNMRKAIIKHEQDTLKEFVEWQAKQYKDLYYEYEEEINNEKDHDDYLWLLGRKAGIGEIRKRLNQDLEDFIKETL